MRQSLLSSGGSSLKLLGLVSAFSVVAVLAACAEAPVDDDPSGGTTSNVNKAEPEGESQKLPPPSNPPAEKKEEKDAGTSSSSSGGSSSGSTSSSSSGSTSSSGGSSSGGSSSGGSSSGGTGVACDMNDPLNLILALDELNKATPRTCGLMGGSCSTGECCFDVYGVCIDSP